MAVFEYTARDSAGKILAGSLEGDSEAIVAQKLWDMGFFVTDLHRRAQAANVEDIFARWRGVPLKELVVFSRQFATMVSAGLSLVRTLSILEEQITHVILRDTVRQVRVDVEGGSTLSNALSKHPRVFNNLYVNMVRAGEAGGVLDDVLLRLATFLEKEMMLRNKIKSAMTYPSLLFVAALGALLFMTIVIIPQFADFFKQLGGDAPLPVPTQIALLISVLIRHFWWLGLLILVGLIVGIRRYVRTRTGREQYDRFKLRLPLLGPVVKKIVVARFTRTFGTLVSSGVPIMRALEVVAQAIDNTVLGRAIESIRSSIREGESIAIPLGASGMFPLMVVQMVRVGEETGALDTMLNKVADFYDGEVEATVNSLTSILEPIMIVGMGAVIGSLLLAMYLPIFGLANAIK
ncbi:MAG TPA: type II secretion system F family protein [bacterium]|nr:type II secretion system F family protein [bacterium]